MRQTRQQQIIELSSYKRLKTNNLDRLDRLDSTFGEFEHHSAFYDVVSVVQRIRPHLSSCLVCLAVYFDAQRNVALKINSPWKNHPRVVDHNALIQLHTLMARLFSHFINSLQIMCRACAVTSASMKGFA